MEKHVRWSLGITKAANLTGSSEKTLITEKYSLTTPTLVGTTLHMCDLKRILALDVG
jgi:hypothetical protein